MVQTPEKHGGESESATPPGYSGKRSASSDTALRLLLRVSQKRAEERKSAMPPGYSPKPLDLGNGVMGPFLPKIKDLDSSWLSESNSNSKSTFGRLLSNQRTTSVEETADAAHARCEAATSTIENAIEIALAAGGDVKTAVQEASKSIQLVLRAAFSFPRPCFDQATLDAFLLALSKLSTSRATDLAAGMPWQRALLVSQNTKHAVLERLRTDVWTKYDVDFRTSEMRLAFMGFMGPLHHVSPSCAPALANALNTAFSCLLRDFIKTTEEQRYHLVYDYSKYTDHFVREKLAAVN